MNWSTRTGSGFFTGYYNDPEANAERMRDGMYWSGDLAYKDAEGWIYLAGRTADWMRVDGENLAAAPIERILLRHKAVNRVAVYAVPDERVGDQVMAAVVLHDGRAFDPESFEAFLDAQPDLSAKGASAIRPDRRGLGQHRHPQGAQTSVDRRGNLGRRRRNSVGAGRTGYRLPLRLGLWPLKAQCRTMAG